MRGYKQALPAIKMIESTAHGARAIYSLATAGFAMWNVGLALIVGIILAYPEKRGLLRLQAAPFNHA